MCNSFFLSACPWGENCVHWSVFFLIGFCFFLKCTYFSTFILQKRKDCALHVKRNNESEKKISKGNQSWPCRLTNHLQWICSTRQARNIHNGTYGILNILIYESIFRKYMMKTVIWSFQLRWKDSVRTKKLFYRGNLTILVSSNACCSFRVMSIFFHMSYSFTLAVRVKNGLLGFFIICVCLANRRVKK